jgi:hypothetical protein
MQAKMADITYYVALPFVWIGDGLFPAEAEECPKLATAIARADVLALVPENAGVVAYCRTFDPDRGISGEAVIVRRLGQLPDDLSMLF